MRVGPITSTLIITVALSVIIPFIAEKECEAKGVSFDDINYTVIGGCMVKSNGKWFPLENVIIEK